jgi:hypothetical protein
MSNQELSVIDKLRGSRDIDGVVAALTHRGALYDDKLADVYKDLWELATEPDVVVAQRQVSSSEKNVSVETRRRAKVLRRLGTLLFADNYIQSLLGSEQESDPFNFQPPLTDVYRDSLGQIATMNGITESEIEARRQLLQDNPNARPWFMR